VRPCPMTDGAGAESPLRSSEIAETPAGVAGLAGDSLTESECQLLQRLTKSCSEFQGREQRFCRLMRQHVRPLIDFTLAIASLETLTGSSFRTAIAVGIDCPPTVLRALSLANLLARKNPILWEATDLDATILDATELADIGSRAPHFLPLVRGPTALCGYVDSTAGSRSRYIFAGFGAGAGDKVCLLLRRIAPHVHVPLARWELRARLEPVQLTLAEREVTTWLLRQKSNKEIAARLGKSVATVRNQLHTIFRKLHVRTRAAAVARLQMLSLELTGRRSAKDIELGYGTSVPLRRPEAGASIACRTGPAAKE